MFPTNRCESEIEARSLK